jgi:hypothetical protein
VSIPLLRELLEPYLAILPSNLKSQSIHAIQQSQVELAKTLQGTINDVVRSYASNMGRDLQSTLRLTEPESPLTQALTRDLQSTLKLTEPESPLTPGMIVRSPWSSMYGHQPLNNIFQCVCPL